MKVRFLRFMQWFCVVFCVFDFGAGTWRAVEAQWGWMAFELSSAAFMAYLWRVNGRTIERIESFELERELWL